MSTDDKPLVWLQTKVTSPPFSFGARIEAGYLLRRLQGGKSLGMPESRPMPVIGPRCHELRVLDVNVAWRLIYRVDFDAIVLVEVFKKQSTKTPKRVIDVCRARLRNYDDA